MVNGFIIGANVTAGGCGYSNAPAITFLGEGGTGASGYAQLSNGSVTNIVITAAGSGYPAETAIQISPPVYPLLSIGTSVMALPSGAATPVVVNEFIVGANVTAAGAGYEVPPAVSFADVSGQGASALAQISNGSITNIEITSAGSGYSTNTVINIAAPPIQQVVILSASNLMVGQDYELQSAPDLATWTPVGMPFSPAQIGMTLLTNSWGAITNTSPLFFRLQTVK